MMEQLLVLTVSQLKELMKDRGMKINYPNKDSLCSALYHDIDNSEEAVEEVISKFLNKDEGVKPGDSISQVSSKSGSSEEEKDLDALKRESKRVKELEEVEFEMLKLEQRKRRLLLESKMEKAKIKGKGLGKTPDSGKSDVSSIHSKVSGSQKGDKDNGSSQRDKILETLVSFNLRSKIPEPSVEKFSGDLTKYQTFVQAFEHTIASKLSDEDEKLFYLDQYTDGKPREIVRACLHMDPKKGYQEATALLKKRYGNPERIATAYVERVLEWPEIRNDEFEELDEFSILLTSCKNAMSNIPYGIAELDNPKTMRKIVEKFPFSMRDKWRRKVDLILEAGERVKFSHLVKFVEAEARVANNPLFGKHLFSQQKQRNKPHVKVTHHKNFNVNVTSPKIKCWYCSKNHLLDDCEELQEIPNDKKIEILMQMRLCFGCLRTGHMSRACRKRKECKICKELHPTLLHRYDSYQDKEEENFGEGDEKKVKTLACVHGGHVNHGMTVIPVKIKGPNGRIVETHAFLDGGSSASFCTKKLMQDLGVNFGALPKVNLRITTMNGESMEENAAMAVGLTASDIKGNSYEELPPVFAVKKIPVERNEVIKPSCAKQWEHLKAIEIPDLNADVGIMIGANAPRVTEPWAIIHSTPESSAYAVRTKLGWIIYGGGESKGLKVSVNRTSVRTSTELDKLLIQEYNRDFSDVFNSDMAHSQEDKRWLQHAREGYKLIAGKYEVPLPLINENLKLPDNFCSVSRRLTGLKRRFLKDEQFKEEYFGYMSSIIESGYAEEVPENELENKPRWYIPHFGVRHPDKPGKTRVVHDCAARFDGVALNDLLSQGPDLNSPLLEVLLRFRQGKYAYTADIEKMFFQVLVPKEQRDYLRFLWWKNFNLDEEPVVYRMTVHLFGACSSPSCSIFALKQTAEDNQKIYADDVCSTIHENFYVDDCLKSCDTELELVENALQVQELCGLGGFNLTKFVSNSMELRSSLSEEHIKDIVGNSTQNDTLNPVKTLGIVWNVQKDLLQVPLRVSSPGTKRELLSSIAGIFDPMGIAAPWVLEGRLIVQELCRFKLSWDDYLNDHFLDLIQNWTQKLENDGPLSVPRCLVEYPFNEILLLELHIFCDASMMGYGAVAYVRATSKDGSCLKFIMGKAKVCPLKSVSVPRLELSAAALAVDLYQVVQRSLSFSFNQVLFWTDSTTVLKYIRNETARFKTFVANRIAKIREGSKVSQWRYVSSELNPADEASRAKQSSRWICGPEFLLKGEEHWPKQPQLVGLEKDMEIKGEIKTFQIGVEDASNPTEKFLGYNSSWGKLLRRLTILRKFMFYIAKKDIGTKQIKVEDLRVAERAIITYLQRENYTQEIKAISRGEFVKKRSPIARLNPFLKDGIVRVGGRLNRLNLSFDEKHPVILPGNNNVTRMIVRDYHERFGHMGTNFLLSEVRRRFWIVKGRATIKAEINKCVLCRRNRGKVLEQQMSSLPVDRAIEGRSPFHVTGMDCFGPFFVKQGRAQVKRYGVLFTCFSVRAVHLEVAHDLTSDTFINVLRRFLARRGGVKKIYCDRGTNFIGAYKELNRVLECSTKISQEMVSRGVDWVFNPPGASHFGGVWERMIRSVRRIFESMLGSQVMTDDSLLTLFCEVEYIMNSRPLSAVSSDAGDVRPLSPNDLINIEGSIDQFGEIEKGSFVQRRWRQVQSMANQFWNRWKKEYLLALQERQKWLTSSRNVGVGDVVLVSDHMQPRCHWPLGLITQVKLSEDGLVRSATIKLMNSVVERPLSKLIMILEAEEDTVSVSKM